MYDVNRDRYREFKMDKIDALVSATDFERHCLWVKNDERPHPRFGGEKRPWVEEGMGFGQTIGTINDRPVFMTFSFATISGKRICFWELTSQLADYEMADRWIARNFPGVRKTNAMNFHNAF